MKLPAVGCLGCFLLWGQATESPIVPVARIGYLYGSASIQPPGGEPAQASLDYPLVAGDVLTTRQDADAGVEIAGAVIHLAPHSSLEISHLNAGMFAIVCTEGIFNVRVFRHAEDDIFAIDTPQASISLLGSGSYRIDVSPEGDSTRVLARSGSAEIAVGDEVYSLTEGRALEISSPALTAAFLPAEPPDPWDEWCAERNVAEERLLASPAKSAAWEISTRGQGAGSPRKFDPEPVQRLDRMGFLGGTRSGNDK